MRKTFGLAAILAVLGVVAILATSLFHIDLTPTVKAPTTGYSTVENPR